MIKTFKAISKQLFGAKYERIGNSLLVSGILFWALYMAEIKLTVAPFIFYLTSTVFTACIMWQALRMGKDIDTMQGVFMLPLNDHDFVFSYVLALGSYTLITKTLIVWVLFLAIGKWEIVELITALVCGCNACLALPTAYWLFKKKFFVLPTIWMISILFVIFIIQHTLEVLTISLVSLGLAAICLIFIDPYIFYEDYSKKKKVCYSKKKGSILVYFIRYLQLNKNYMLNTIGLCVIACFLPFLFGQFEGINVMPIGFAILSLNTPLCTLMSCDPDLEQAIRVLPGQAKHLGSRYCLFIGIIHLLIMCIYLCGWQIVNGGVSVINIWLAILFALQSAILSVLLEWVYPIRGWKIESDLWHHPRKYIVPLGMILIAVFVATWMSLIWIWSIVLLIEIIIMLHVTRRL